MTLEEAQAKILELEDENKTLKEDITNYKTSDEKQKSRISELEQHNQKLFLRVTSPNKKKEVEEEKFTSKLMGDYINHLDDEQIELLKELEEEL